MTTVGYGDVVPRTICGKLFGSACAMMGKCENDLQNQEGFIQTFHILSHSERNSVYGVSGPVFRLSL